MRCPRRAFGEDAPVPAARSSPSLDHRRARVSDLIDGTRPLTARSVLASALLGAREPRLPVSHLVAVASLFGISPGAARTCLWRMVSNGELTTDDATYALTGRLLERRHRVDDVARHRHVGRDWDGTWELAVVSLDRRDAAARAELRKAATALHLAEIREGVWARPDNLDPERLPASRAVLDRQCVGFRHAASDIPVETVRSLFHVEPWSDDARRLVAAMEDEMGATDRDRDQVVADLPYQFTLSIAAVRHLQADPLLPAALLPEDWPAETLRTTYRTFDDVFQQRMNDAAPRSAGRHA
jgi:phenylacetic acid degradation operon negative regulatory protein